MFAELTNISLPNVYQSQDADWNWIDPPNTFGEPSIDDLFL